MSDSTVAVHFSGVKKNYGPVEALKGIDFKVEKGSFFGLLGPNGAGKSTLINSMAGLVNPTAGDIWVHDYHVQQDYRAARRTLGLVPQELIADPFFSIKELLQIQSGYFGLKGIEQKKWIDELLERLALTEKANAITNQLSGGMKRRLLIAMALVHKPEVLVLDEPTAGVDVDLRRTLWEFTKELHRQGHTIILTTHYLEEAESLCEKVAIIQQGSLKALEKTDVLLSRHQYRYLRVTTEKGGGELSLSSNLIARLVEQDSNGLLFKVEKSLSLNLILGWLSEANIVVKDVSSRDASLEEVFLDLTNEKRT